MHAYLAIALALAAPALAVTRDRFGYEREIDSAHNQHHKLLDYVLDDQQLAAQKNRGKLITRTKPDDVVASDNVILESKVLTLLSYPKKKVENKNGEDLVRTRRGYNLENVRVPARYPYLAVPQYNRFRRWG